MSNYLAIAAVTSTFSQWLLEKACSVLDGALTTIGRPKEGTPKGINIYLYQVMYNPDRRNENFPVRRSGDTTFAQRPQAALDLYYLLTFYGSEKDLEPQILLGSTVSVLHAQPVLTQDMLRREIKRRTDSDTGDILAKYEASGQIQSIAFTPLSYNTEEFAKLWSMLFQVTYTLSVAYKASAVYVEAEVNPQKALPVLRPDTYVLPFRRPFIEKISPASGDLAPVVYNSKIVVKGRQLKGDPTKVSIGEVEVKIDQTDPANTVTDMEINLDLGSSLFAGKAFRAGIIGMSVLHPVMMGEPKVEHYGFESNIKPMIFSPTITNTTINGTNLTVEVNPKIGKTQKVAVLLNEFQPVGAPHAFSIKAPDNNGITSDLLTETDSVTFPVDNVTPGNYLLRIQVDGAESPLEVSAVPANPEFNGPLVSIP
jgi:hypothetical protein